MGGWLRRHRVGLVLAVGLVGAGGAMLVDAARHARMAALRSNGI